MSKLMVLALALLAGCASVSAVMPMDNGEYTVTADSHAVSSGIGGTRTKALAKANEFCAARQEKLTTVKLDSQMGINTYATSLVFRCE